MAKTLKKLSLDPAHQALVQNVLVDLMRAAIQHGVLQEQLGAELMAQGYAMLTAKDMAEARSAVIGIIGRTRKRAGAVSTSSKRAAAKKLPAKKNPTKRSTAKKRPVRSPHAKD